MKVNRKRLVRNLAVVSLLAVSSFVFVGQGCSGFESGSDVASRAGLCTTAGSSAAIDKNYEVIPGTRTVSIAYGDQLLDSMVSCTGILEPSDRTIAEWQSRNQSLSEYGRLTDLSAALMMASTAVAGEVCEDLLLIESAVAPASRGMFTNIDITGAGLSGSEIDNVTRNFALSCWQRMPSTEELTIVREGVAEINANSRTSLLSICTSMLSSLAGLAQ